MSKTLFSTKCKILTELVETYDGDSYYDALFDYWNMAFPFAMGAHYGMLILTDTGEAQVEELWNHLCKDIYHIDPLGDYEDLEEFEQMASIEGTLPETDE